MAGSPTPPIAAWKLFPIVAAIAFPIVGGFYLGGPGLGMAVGGAAAAAILAMAVRKPPVYPIEPPVPPVFRRHVLIVLTAPIEEPAQLEALIGQLGSAGSAPKIRLAAPARHGRLARWTSDLEPGRERARRALVQGAAQLAKAGYAADARVCDESVVQGVEDELRAFPATEVLLFAAPSRELGAAVEVLERRLTVPLRQLGSSPALMPAPASTGSLVGAGV